MRLIGRLGKRQRSAFDFCLLLLNDFTIPFLNLAPPSPLRYTLPMRSVARIILLLLCLILVMDAGFFLFTRITRAEFGPTVALCPGPDNYGYTCTGGEGFAAIDATHDTGLYADDGTVSLELPFVFTFYGTDYTVVQASSNGNLQFGNGNAAYENTCLTAGPAAGMGDMIAPYWDDLDLTYMGFLETETIGTEPDRIFVVEWDDVPRYSANDDDRVTFSVQLFEGSNDIVFLYEDVGMFDGKNGRSATIGLQSAAQGLALQYSCNQAAVRDSQRLHIVYPEKANADLGRGNVLYRPQENVEMRAKGEITTLISALNLRGPRIMAALQKQWLNQRPQRMSEWTWLPDENGRSQLLLLWRGPQARPDLAQLILLAADEQGQWTLQFNHRFVSREETHPQIKWVAAADVTADGLADVLLRDKENGRSYLFTSHANTPSLHTLPETCTGNITIHNNAIIRSGCQTPGKFAVIWNGSEFVPK